jgi:hypothetical protein
MAASFASRLSNLREKKLIQKEEGNPTLMQREINLDSPYRQTPHRNLLMNPPLLSITPAARSVSSRTESIEVNLHKNSVPSL